MRRQPWAARHEGNLMDGALQRDGAGTGCAGQGHPGRRREQRHDQEALRHDRVRVDRGPAPRVPRDALHDDRRGRPRQRRDPLRRDHPPERLRRSSARQDPRVAGHHPRHQGRQGYGRSSRSRPTSWSPTVSTACAVGLVEYRELGARFAKWRAVITIGAHIPSRLCLDLNAHALGALRRALPGRGHRADRRARGADGRRPLARALLPGHLRTLHTVFDALYDQRVELDGHVA